MGCLLPRVSKGLILITVNVSFGVWCTKNVQSCDRKYAVALRPQLACNELFHTKNRRSKSTGSCHAAWINRLLPCWKIKSTRLPVNQCNDRWPIVLRVAYVYFAGIYKTETQIPGFDFTGLKKMRQTETIDSSISYFDIGTTSSWCSKSQASETTNAFQQPAEEDETRDLLQSLNDQIPITASNRIPIDTVQQDCDCFHSILQVSKDRSCKDRVFAHWWEDDRRR